MSDIAFLKKTMAFKGLTYDASKTKEENQKIFIAHESSKTKKTDSAGPKKTIVKTPLSARKKEKSVAENAEDDDEEKIAFFKTERPKLIKTGKFKSESALQTELKKMWAATKDESSKKGVVLPYTELTIELSAEDQAAMGLEKIGTKGDGTFIYRPVTTPSKKEKKSPVKPEKKEEITVDDDDEEEPDAEGDEEDDDYEETEVIDKAQLIEFLKKNVQKHIWKSIMSDMGEKVSGTMTDLIDRFLGKFNEYVQAGDDEEDAEDEEGEEGEEEDDEE